MEEDITGGDINFEKVCRTCLGQFDDMKSVFTYEGNFGNTTFSSIVGLCTQVKVTEGDGLPNSICIRCIDNANVAYAFKQQVEKTDSRLRDFMIKKFPHLALGIKQETDDKKFELKNGVFDVTNTTAGFNSDDSDDDCRPLKDLLNPKEKTPAPDPAALQLLVQNHLVCDFCNMLFLSANSLDAHRHTHRAGYVQCDICYRAFPTSKLLKRHKYDYHTKHIDKKFAEKPPEDDSVTCQYCSYIFERKEQLDAHMAKSHYSEDSTPSKPKRGRPKKDGSSKKKKDRPIEEPMVEIKTEEITDDVPTLDLDGTERLVETKEETFPDYSDDDDPFFGGDDDLFQMEPPPPKKYRRRENSSKRNRVHKCSICSKTFSRTNHIIRHMAAHNYEFPHKCHICSKVFPNEELLLRHKRQQCENTTKSFQCGTCTMKFTFERTLEKHIASKHKGENVDVKHLDTNPTEKTFFCTVCNKGFFRQEQLNKHSLIHEPNAVMYDCSVCHKAFRRKDNLRTHMKVHNPHRPKPQAKFLCIHCGRYFTSNSCLTVHMRRHTGEKPYKCEICGKGFPRGTDLNCHRRTHTGEKPWSCKVCGRGFSRSTKLTRHMRIHTGQKPYKCTFCEKAFAQSNDLTLHIRRHTGDKPYVCGICGDRFIQGTALQNHRRTKGHFEEDAKPALPANSVNNLNRGWLWNTGLNSGEPS